MVSICVPDLYFGLVHGQEHREPALPYFLRRFDPRFNGEKVDLFSSDAGHNSEPFQSLSRASTEPLQSSQSSQSFPEPPRPSISRASTASPEPVQSSQNPVLQSLQSLQNLFRASSKPPKPLLCRCRPLQWAEPPNSNSLVTFNRNFQIPFNF